MFSVQAHSDYFREVYISSALYASVPPVYVVWFIKNSIKVRFSLSWKLMYYFSSSPLHPSYTNISSLPHLLIVLFFGAPFLNQWITFNQVFAKKNNQSSSVFLEDVCHLSLFSEMKLLTFTWFHINNSLFYIYCTRVDPVNDPLLDCISLYLRGKRLLKSHTQLMW